MTGLHVVKKSLKLCDRWYVYAWRGGPCIYFQDDRAPVISHEILCKQQAVLASRYGESANSFNFLIQGFEQSAAYANLAEATKTDRKLWLTRASERFGKVPYRVFNDRRMRAEIITWRDVWKEQPRTADKATEIVQLVLSWGFDNGLLESNVALGIKKLYSVDRAELIWEDKHWAAVEAADPPAHLMTALRLASWTGLRLSDLVELTWDEVKPQAIIRFTNKGRKRQTRAVIPILAPLQAWIATIPEKDRIGTVLKNSRGVAWSKKGSGLESVWQKKQPEGFDRTLHDLRGTFCTMLILKGLTDDQCAMVMGWASQRIAAIRTRYVDEQRVILSLLDKLSA